MYVFKLKTVLYIYLMFTVLDILFSSIVDKNICENTQKIHQSHSLPRMKKPHARNGNVTRNRGGNCLEREREREKTTLMFVKI